MSEQSEVERLSDKLTVEIASAAVDSYLHHEIERDGWAAKDACYIDKITTTAKPILDALIAAVRAEAQQQTRLEMAVYSGLAERLCEVEDARDAAIKEAESLREQLKQAQHDSAEWSTIANHKSSEVARLRKDAERLIREGSMCDACQAGDELWMESDTKELRHGSGDDVGECDCGIIAEAVELGIVVPVVYPRCPAGHEWWGNGCPECAALADPGKDSKEEVR